MPTDRRVTLDEIRRLLLRLTTAYGQPYGLAGDSLVALAETWQRTLGDCEFPDLSEAVDGWLRTERKWPSPAAIRADALARYRERQPQAKTHSGFCLRCETPDLIELANGRFAPLHADDCPGLHPNDRLDLQHALATGQPIWRNGADPSRDRRSMPERLRAMGLLPPEVPLASRVATAPDSSAPLSRAPDVSAPESFTLED